MSFLRQISRPKPLELKRSVTMEMVQKAVSEQLGKHKAVLGQRKLSQELYTTESASGFYILACNFACESCTRPLVGVIPVAKEGGKALNLVAYLHVGHSSGRYQLCFNWQLGKEAVISYPMAEKKSPLILAVEAVASELKL